MKILAALPFLLLPLQSFAFDFDGDKRGDEVIIEGDCETNPVPGKSCMVSVSLSSGSTYPIMAGERISSGLTRRKSGQIDANRTMGQALLRIDEVTFGIGPNGPYPALDAITAQMLFRAEPTAEDLTHMNAALIGRQAEISDLVTFIGRFQGNIRVRVVIAAHPAFGITSPWIITDLRGKILASGKSLDFPRIFPGAGRLTVIDARLDGMSIQRISTE